MKILILITTLLFISCEKRNITEMNEKQYENTIQITDKEILLKYDLNYKQNGIYGFTMMVNDIPIQKTIRINNIEIDSTLFDSSQITIFENVNLKYW